MGNVAVIEMLKCCPQALGGNLFSACSIREIVLYLVHAVLGAAESDERPSFLEPFNVGRGPRQEKTSDAEHLHSSNIDVSTHCYITVVVDHDS